MAKNTEDGKTEESVRVRFDEALRKAFDDYRRGQDPIPTKQQAASDLIRRGLDGWLKSVQAKKTEKAGE